MSVGGITFDYTKGICLFVRQNIGTIDIHKCLVAEGAEHCALRAQNPVREAILNKKSCFYGHFPYGGGAQPHSIAFGGVFTNFTEAIFG